MLNCKYRFVRMYQKRNGLILPVVNGHHGFQLCEFGISRVNFAPVFCRSLFCFFFFPLCVVLFILFCVCIFLLKEKQSRSRAVAYALYVSQTALVVLSAWRPLARMATTASAESQSLLFCGSKRTPGKQWALVGQFFAKLCN